MRIPIVILHGWNLSSEHFKPLEQRLIQLKYRVYSLDLPGFGSAAIPQKPWTVQDYANFVYEFIQKKKLKEIILIGHSFGGRIAIVLASKYRSLIKGIILTGTPGLNHSSKKKLNFFYLLAKSGNVILSFTPFLKDVARKILYKLAGSYDYYRSSGVMRQTLKRILAYDLKDHLKNIDQPTLLIWGAGDKTVPVSVANNMLKYLKNSELKIIPYGNHNVPYTYPKEFSALIDTFLNQY